MHAKALWTSRGLGLGQALCSSQGKGLPCPAGLRGCPGKEGSSQHCREARPTVGLLSGVWPRAPKFHVPGQLCPTSTSPHSALVSFYFPNLGPEGQPVRAGRLGCSQDALERSAQLYSSLARDG